jgi:hypothetical protein
MHNTSALIPLMFLGSGDSMQPLFCSLYISTQRPVSYFFRLCFALCVILPIYGAKTDQMFAFMFALFMQIIIVVASTYCNMVALNVHLNIVASQVSISL